MARPNERFFTKDDLHLEGSIIKIIKSAKAKPGPGTKMIIDRALDTLSDLYDNINKRGK